MCAAPWKSFVTGYHSELWKSSKKSFFGFWKWKRNQNFVPCLPWYSSSNTYEPSITVYARANGLKPEKKSARGLPGCSFRVKGCGSRARS